LLQEPLCSAATPQNLAPRLSAKYCAVQRNSNGINSPLVFLFPPKAQVRLRRYIFRKEKGGSCLSHCPHTSTHIVFCVDTSSQEPLCSAATPQNLARRLSTKYFVRQRKSFTVGTQGLVVNSVVFVHRADRIVEFKKRAGLPLIPLRWRRGGVPKARRGSGLKLLSLIPYKNNF
jgi:hypothetical protein